MTPYYPHYFSSGVPRTTNALQVNGSPDWMLADSRVSYQLDPRHEEGEGEKEGEEEEKEVEQNVTTTTMAPEGSRVPVFKKKYTVVLPYVRGILERLHPQLQREFVESLPAL